MALHTELKKKETHQQNSNTQTLIYAILFFKTLTFDSGMSIRKNWCGKNVSKSAKYDVTKFFQNWKNSRPIKESS